MCQFSSNSITGPFDSNKLPVFANPPCRPPLVLTIPLVCTLSMYAPNTSAYAEEGHMSMLLKAINMVTCMTRMFGKHVLCTGQVSGLMVVLVDGVLIWSEKRKSRNNLSACFWEAPSLALDKLREAFEFLCPLHPLTPKYASKYTPNPFPKASKQKKYKTRRKISEFCICSTPQNTPKSSPETKKQNKYTPG